jgi:hypothetical protein
MTQRPCGIGGAVALPSGFLLAWMDGELVRRHQHDHAKHEEPWPTHAEDGAVEGRISLALAARGHEVTGVDLSEAFLAEAARKAKDRGLSVRWKRGDMRDLDFESEFEAAVNFGGSFGFRRRRKLPDGGERPSKPCPRRTLPHRHAHARDHLPAVPRTALVRVGRDCRPVRKPIRPRDGPARDRLDRRRSDGRRERLHSSIRLYSYRELAVLLRGIGFTHIEGYDAEDLAPSSSAHLD